MNFIKKIFDKKSDENLHLQFQKFSRGEFRGKAIIQAKFSAGKFTINTSPEFAADFVRLLADKLGNQKTKVTGAIVSTSDLTGKISFKDKKQFQGIKTYLMESEMSGDEILKLMKEFPKVFFGLSFEDNGGNVLKIKPKAPFSGKGGSPKGDGTEKKVDFCKLITRDPKIVASFIFEKPEFKIASINHTFFIEEIIIPSELKSEKDFAKVRESAIRKGKIIRKATIDGKEFKTEMNFEA